MREIIDRANACQYDIDAFGGHGAQIAEQQAINDEQCEKLPEQGR